MSLHLIVLFACLSKAAPFVPLSVGDIVVEGPDWSSERTGKEGHVTELRDGGVKVKWSFLSRSWHAYDAGKKREVMGKEQVEEVRGSMRGGGEEEEERKEQQDG